MLSVSGDVIEVVRGACDLPSAEDAASRPGEALPR